tara:strand:- start:19 stop:270 length:252 start_codon:yes stop_codon:yes gene_type:complete
MALVSSSAVSFKLAAEPTMVTAANIIIPVSTSAVSFKLAAEPNMVTAVKLVIPRSTSAVSFSPITVASGGGGEQPTHRWLSSF